MLTSSNDSPDSAINSPSLKKNIFNILKYVAMLAIGVALLFLAFRGVNLRATFEEIREVNIFWLSVSTLASIVAFVSRAWRWNMLIEPAGYKLDFKPTLYSVMIGYLANLALPRFGEVTRCGSLSKATKVPFEILFGTVIVERVIDVISLLFCIVLVGFLEYKRLGSFLRDSLYEPLQAKASLIISSPLFYIGIAVILLLVVFLIRAHRKSGKQSGIIKKVSDLAVGVLQGLKTVRKLKNPGAFLFHSVLIWFMYFLMAYTCFFALPATSALGWKAGLFVLVVGGMGMSAPVQGGIGTYHLMVSQGLILFGLAREHGLAYATLMHTTQTLFIIVTGSLSMLLLFLADRKKSHVLNT